MLHQVQKRLKSPAIRHSTNICIQSNLKWPGSPFSHWGDATAFRSRKKSTALNSWRVVIASWLCWWEKRHYELKVRPVGDCKVIFSWSNCSRVASVGERPWRYLLTCSFITSRVYGNLILIVHVIQNVRKLTQPIPDTHSVCKKIHYIKIWKQKTMLY
jgi:hypothetical protein